MAIHLQNVYLLCNSATGFQPVSYCHCYDPAPDGVSTIHSVYCSGSKHDDDNDIAVDDGMNVYSTFKMKSTQKTERLSAEVTVLCFTAALD